MSEKNGVSEEERIMLARYLLELRILQGVIIALNSVIWIYFYQHVVENGVEGVVSMVGLWYLQKVRRDECEEYARQSTPDKKK